MRNLLAAFVMTGVAASGLAAQGQPAIKDVRVSRAQPTRWEIPDCGLNKGNFMISSGATYLKSGVEASDEVKKAKLYGDGLETLLEGIRKGQAGASGAWYYLGRAYLYLGDLHGADTALTRAQDLAPACAKDIQQTRRNTWVQLLNAGIGFVKAENTDSAVVLFNQANEIYTGEPNAFMNLALIYNNKGMPDSAIAYFRRAVTSAGADPKGVEGRNQAQYNLAALLSNTGRWKEAVAAWQQYLQWVPDDADAKKGYARALRGDGQPDAAAAVERELISSAGDAVPATDLMTAGVNFFNDKNYTEAAATFARVVQREPWNRDALFNLANSYLGAQNGPELVKAGQALTAIEPMNESSVKLLAQGYQLEKAQDSVIKAYTRLEAMPFSLEIEVLNLQAGGAKVKGTATGRAAKKVDTTPIAPHPVTLVFEFLDKDMGVVASSERIVPALNPGQTSVVEAEGLGSGIVGWRYRVR